MEVFLLINLTLSKCNKKKQTVNLSNNSWLLQQILLYLGALDGTFLIKMNVNVFAKSTRVVIPDCLGITKCYKQRICITAGCWTKQHYQCVTVLIHFVVKPKDSWNKIDYRPWLSHLSGYQTNSGKAVKANRSSNETQHLTNTSFCFTR